jgi:hypothetical protein
MTYYCLYLDVFLIKKTFLHKKNLEIKKNAVPLHSKVGFFIG